MTVNVVPKMNNYHFIGCAHCKSTFFSRDKTDLPICPICGSDCINQIDKEQEFPDIELVIPGMVSQPELKKSFSNYLKPVKFKPNNLNVETLLKNVIPVFFPLWLVDSNFSGNWTANFGFDYQVQSTKEYYKDQVWHSQTVDETRINWEPRAGIISSGYENITTEAVMMHNWLQKILNRYDLSSVKKVNSEDYSMGNGNVLIFPDIDHSIAWKKAEDIFVEKIKMDCQKAADAQHTRAFSGTFNYQEKKWTLCLMPYFFTWYLDDKDNPQPIWSNAQSGTIGGIRTSSFRKSAKYGLISLALSFMFLVIMLIAGYFSQGNDIFAIISIIAFPIFLVSAIFGVYAFIYPWVWNRNNRRYQHKSTN